MRLFFFSKKKKVTFKKRLKDVCNEKSSNMEVNTWQYLRWVSIFRVLKSLRLPLKVIETSHNPKMLNSILRLFSFYILEEFFNGTLM